MPQFACLPTEIVHDIVDHLLSDTPSLHRAALVNRTLLASARRHIFHTIHITDARLCLALDRALRINPALGVYVRALTLSDSGWLDATIATTCIGPALTSVRSLSLLHLDWTGLSDTTARYLSAHFGGVCTLELQHPVLQDWGDLVRLLAPRPQLTSLTLGRARLRGPTRSPDGSGRGVGRNVRTLSTAGPSLHDSVDALLAWLPHLRPRTLRVQTIEDTHVPDMARLLQAQGSALGAFEMCTWAFHAPAWQGSSRPCIKVLRTGQSMLT